MKISDIIIENRTRKYLGNIQELADSISSVGLLHPIVVTPENKLIAGYRRIMAYRLLGKEEIPHTVIDNLNGLSTLAEQHENTCRLDFTPSEAVEIGRVVEPLERELAAKRKQLGYNQYNLPPENFSDGSGNALDKVASITGLSRPTYSKAKKIVDAARENPELEYLVKEMDRSGKVDKVFKQLTKSETQQKDDNIKVFNLWNFSDNDMRFGFDYPGRIPGQIIENLLYYYAKSGDIVVDPFSGSGTTLDVCNTLGFSCLAYDIKPSRDDIKQHDISCGFPTEAKDCNLVFLDPPYWSQRQGDYSAHSTNLANLSLKDFYQTMDFIFGSAHGNLQENGYIAVIISPTQIDGIVYDHAFELAKLLEKKFKFINRIIIPYTMQQTRPFHITDARKGHFMLKLYRDLLVYQK